MGCSIGEKQHLVPRLGRQVRRTDRSRTTGTKQPSAASPIRQRQAAYQVRALGTRIANAAFLVFDLGHDPELDAAGETHQRVVALPNRVHLNLFVTE